SSFPFNPIGLVNGPQSNGYTIEGRPRTQAQPKTDNRVVTAGYFETVRQPIIKGRSFSAHDNEEKAPQLLIINQTMARHQFPGEDPIGKRIVFAGGARGAEIIGVAADVKEYGLDQPTVDEIYGALRNGFIGRLVVRTSAEPNVVEPQI